MSNVEPEEPAAETIPPEVGVTATVTVFPSICRYNEGALFGHIATLQDLLERIARKVGLDI